MKGYKWAAIILTPILILGVVGYIKVSRRFDEAWGPKIDAGRYPGIVQTRLKWSDSGYGFLPTTIDPSALKTAFYHMPHLLMQGDVICLRLQLPPEKIDALVRQLESSGRVEVPDLSKLPETLCYPSFDMKPPAEEWAGVGKLPTGFRIFLHESDLDEIMKDYGGHFFLAFTAISKERNEVVYYVDNR